MRTAKWKPRGKPRNAGLCLVRVGSKIENRNLETKASHVGLGQKQVGKALKNLLIDYIVHRRIKECL